MPAIRAITFDLDDTLWDIAPTILRAEAVMSEYLFARFPGIGERYDEGGLHALRREVFASNPDLSHDLTELRRLSFEAILHRSGYDGDHSHALMERFLTLRHEVDFFPDVEAALAALNAKYRLYAISNGNADLARLGIGRCFEGQVSARAVGVGKPDARIFRAASEALGLAPSEILHVGDNPIDDVHGALRAGFRAAWINRRGAAWEREFKPHITCADLHQFHSLLDACDADP